jgi:RNA polymerase sigma factor (TIGR02999 family)
VDALNGLRALHFQDKAMHPDITELLCASRAGNVAAHDELLNILYPTLRNLAHQQRRLHPADTLSTTALVSESYLRLFGGKQPEIRDREHFFSLVAATMRRILIDQARARLAGKRGSGEGTLRLDNDIEDASRPQELLLIVQLVERLRAITPRLATVVEWHFFGGIDFREIADVLDLNERTVQRDWLRARTLLARWLSSPDVAEDYELAREI